MHNYKTLFLTFCLSFLLFGCNTKGTSQEDRKSSYLDDPDVLPEEIERYQELEKEGYVFKDNLIFELEKDAGYFLVYGFYGKPTKLYVPDSLNDYPVKGLKSFSFNKCTSLKTINIGKNVEHCENAFVECFSLEDIVIDKDNQYLFLQDNMLYSKTNDADILNLVFCPYNVSGELTALEQTGYVSQYAFSSHPTITKIHFGSKLQNSDNDIESIRDIYTLEDVTVSKDNEVYCSNDGVVFSKDMKEMYAIANNRHTNYVIPNEVDNLAGFRLFSNCQKLKTLKLNSRFTIRKAYGETSSLYVEDKTGITPYTIYCPSLEELLVDEQNESFTSINGILYSKDLTKLFCVPPHKDNVNIYDGIKTIGELAFLLNDSCQQVTIPDSVTTLESNSFSWGYHALKNLVIGENVESIGQDSFSDTPNLQNVFYKKNQQAFSSIHIDDNNDDLLNAKMYYYSDTAPEESGNYWHYVDGVVTIW